MSDTDKNAASAGSRIRMPGEIRPVMNPPIKKLWDMNLPTTRLPMTPPKKSSTPMKMAILASIHFFEKAL